MNAVKLCTCTDHACPCHPVNHGQGCTPCIAKNLKDEEIPSCFFRLLETNLAGRDDFSLESFAQFVNERKK